MKMTKIYKVILVIVPLYLTGCGSNSDNVQEAVAIMESEMSPAPELALADSDFQTSTASSSRYEHLPGLHAPYRFAVAARSSDIFMTYYSPAIRGLGSCYPSVFVWANGEYIGLFRGGGRGCTRVRKLYISKELLKSKGINNPDTARYELRAQMTFGDLRRYGDITPAVVPRIEYESGSGESSTGSGSTGGLSSVDSDVQITNSQFGRVLMKTMINGRVMVCKVHSSRLSNVQRRDADHAILTDNFGGLQVCPTGN